MASFWKLYPPGWFAFEWEDDGDGDESGGDWEDGGDGEEDGGDWEDGGEEENDGDSGVDFSWSGDDGEEDGGDWGDGGDSDFDPGDDDDDDDSDRSFERERERREEEERQRQVDEQNRQIEEQRQRMAEEQFSPDADNDGIADRGELTSTAQSATGTAVQENVQGQLADLQEQTQAQNALFDPKSPDWIYQTGGGYRPPPVFQPPPPVTDEEPQTAFTPGPTGPLFDLDRKPEPAFRPPPPVTGSVDIAQTAANAAARAAADVGASPQQIAETAEHAARIASDRQTLAQQSPWTRAAFRSQYGDQAEQEWARQHEAELARNRSLYGVAEPVAGAAPLASAPAGTPLAPDRRIGRTPPPGVGQEARFGINGPTPAGSAAPQSARVAPPGITSPTAQGPAATAPQAVPQAPLRPGGTTTANTLVQPTDYVTIEDTTSKITRLIRGSELPQYTQDVGPGVKSPWRVTKVEPATKPENMPANPQPESLRPVAAPSTLRAAPPAPVPTTPSGGGLSPADQREMDAARPVGTAPSGGGLSPADRREMDAAYESSRWEPLAPEPTDETLEGPHAPRVQGPEGVQQARNIVRYDPATGQTEEPRFTPERNIVGYNPETGETYELPASRRMASTDTALTPEMGVAEPAYRDPVLAAVQTSRPLAALASLAASTRGPDYDPSQDAFHIAHGIAGMLRGEREAVWAEPYLNDVARMAWTREESANGRSVDPRQAPVEYIEKWKDAFYGSDHNVPLVKEIDQEMIDFAAQRTPSGKAFNWKEAFGDPVTAGKSGVIQAQVTAVDCGPNAFANLLRANGYNADPSQTFAFARKYQYHDGNQFTGPQNFVRMVREEAGLDARAVSIAPNGKGWEQIDRELAEGRLVTVSSPGHYWTIAGKNDQGQYYAGATTLKGNPQWMRRQDFIYNGAADTAILVNGAVNPEARALREMQLQPPANTRPDVRALLSGRTEYAQPSMNEQIRTMANRPPATPAEEQGPESFGEYVRWSAARRGLDPDQVGAVMGKEGPEGWASVGRFRTGTSYGPLQLHYAGGPDPQAGMGDDFTRETGIDLRRIDPTTPQGIAAHKRAVDYALDRLAKTGDFREWYGADKAFPGSGRFTPIKRLPQRGGELAGGVPDPSPEEMPAWMGTANVETGQYIGQGRARDAAARLWRNAYQISGGDATFADVIGGVVNGEAGLAGLKDERGATGIYQMDPAGGWQQLDRYLKDHNIQMSRDEAAKNVDIMSDFYTTRLYKSYQRARAAGHTDPEDLVIQTISYQWDPVNERGAAHNSGAEFVPSLARNYIEGYREFKDGIFRMVPENRR